MLLKTSVARAFITALLLILLGQETGAFSALSSCIEQCPAEEGGAASCLPGCADCACCGLTRVVMPILSGGAPAIRTVERLWSVPLAAHAAPDPDDILHVPKSLPV